MTSDENLKIAVVGPTAGFRNFVEYAHKNTAPGDRDEYVHAVSPIHLSGLKKDESGVILLENCHTIREWNNMFPIIRHMSLLNKGRSLKGEKSAKAKLTEKNVKEIRASNKTKEHLSIKFKVSICTIRDVLNRRTWTHVL